MFPQLTALDRKKELLLDNVQKQLWVTVKPFRLVAEVLGSIVKKHKITLIACGVVTGLNFLRTRYQTQLVAKLEATRDAYEAKRRVTQVRKTLSGPLLRAALELDDHIRQLLSRGEKNFFLGNFREKSEVCLMTSIYEIARFIHYRWLLHDQLKFEMVASLDAWQFLVERFLMVLSHAMGSKDVSVQSYTERWMWTPKAGRKAQLSARSACAAVRESLSWHQRQEHPLRFLPFERNAIAELMARDGGAATAAGHGFPECLGFVGFVEEMKQALHAEAGEGTHPWGPYFLPVWKDLVRLVSLELQEPDSLHAVDRLELLQFRVRLRAIQLAVRDMSKVIALPPEAWVGGEMHIIHTAADADGARKVSQKLLVAAKGVRFGERFKDLLRHATNDSDTQWKAYVALRTRARVLWEIVRGHVWFHQLMPDSARSGNSSE